MKFADKLIRLTADTSRAKLSRDAGLPDSSVGDYINKGTEPSAGKALKLAKALKVSLDWLIDDTQDWPPPQSGGRSIKDYPDGELMTEVARRLAMTVLVCRVDLEYVSGKPWHQIATDLYKGQLGKPDPEAIEDVQQAEAVLTRIKNLSRVYDPVRYTDRLPANAGRIEPKQLMEDIATLTEAVVTLREDNQAMMEALHYRDIQAHLQRDPEYAEYERQVTLDKLAKLDPRRSKLSIEGREIVFQDFHDSKGPPVLRAAKRAHPRRGKT